MNGSLLKIHCVAFIDSPLLTPKELRYIMIYEEKSFAMYFDDIAFFQTF